MGEGNADRVMSLGYGTVDGEANADVQKTTKNLLRTPRHTALP
jgi:hypothetical protein